MSKNKKPSSKATRSKILTQSLNYNPKQFSAKIDESSNNQISIDHPLIGSDIASNDNLSNHFTKTNNHLSHNSPTHLGNENNIHSLTSHFDRKLYYMDSLEKALYKHSIDPDSLTLQERSFIDHFEQSLQSLSFVKKLQPIDEECLLERKIYLPPNPYNKKTLILDLDETLVHCNENTNSDSDELNSDKIINIKFANQDTIPAGVNIRPFVKECLQELSKLYEIVVFTASHSCYANVVLNLLDPFNEFITYRLFREHCVQTREGIYIKDLRIIANRDIRNVLIVDNATYSFGFQVYNGIPI